MKRKLEKSPELSFKKALYILRNKLVEKTEVAFFLSELSHHCRFSQVLTTLIKMW